MEVHAWDKKTEAGELTEHKMLCFILSHFPWGLIFFQSFSTISLGGNVGNHESTERYNMLSIFP